MLSVLGVIPARHASQRFPGKPLAPIAGKPMVQWVYEAARRALPRVVVATDDRRILNFIRGLGGEALMTSVLCKSGTDRVAEVARRLPARLYLNIQGDEPLMSSRTVRRVLALHRDRRVAMGTAATVLQNGKAWRDPNVVKVLTDRAGDAVYFSRAPLPFFRDGAPNRPPGRVYKHLGIYSYASELLKRFVRWPEAFLEGAERLEQLRALENGVRIRVAFTPDDSVGVDTPADAARAAALLKTRGPQAPARRNR
ncbi:MAG: 3-deoxy-manno-octulosonate cytidylyltransferase [Elusimicrobiota bacterium]